MTAYNKRLLVYSTRCICLTNIINNSTKNRFKHDFVVIIIVVCIFVLGVLERFDAVDLLKSK